MKKITKKYLSEIDGFKGFEETISNFAIAFLFLSKKPRIAISNFYILCSYLDDIVDTTEPYTIEEKHNLLAQWKENINSIYQNKSILNFEPLKQTLLDFDISQEHINILIDGIGADLKSNRKEDLSDLYQYCYGVASIVGIVCLNFFGDNSSNALKYAEHLGYALQITNIMRDVKVDMERNYIYIPTELFDKHGYSELDLINNIYNEAFIKIMKELATEAEKSYATANSYLNKCENKKLFRSSQMMKEVYHSIFQKIKKSNYRVFDEKIRLTKSEKIKAIYRAFRLT